MYFYTLEIFIYFITVKLCVEKYDTDYYYSITKGMNMKKKIRNDLKKEIRRKFECGEDLIDLAIEYKLNYGTLRNLASKEQWKKNILTELVHLKEIEAQVDEIVKQREKIKSDYQSLTREVVEDLKSLEGMEMEMYVALGEESKSYAETKATVVKLRTSAIKELYSIDKELYQIQSLAEQQDLMIKKLKYEELKRKLNITDDELLGDKKKEDEDIIID